jgi:hypothetical protein
MAALPAFVSMWSSYPLVQMPCNGPWANQCSIRMSIALIGAGFPLTGYTDPTCAHGHARGAESLANFLWRKARRPTIYTSGTAFTAACANQTGISFFKDITGFRGGIGDHIDLWNRGTTKTGSYENDCRQIWFWSA